MKLYIIGNGFDLNHGLPTGYKNYRDYLMNNNQSIAFKYEECQNIQAAEYNRDTKWNDIENGLRLHYEDAFVEMRENYYPDMSSEKTPGWDDINIETDNRFSFLKEFTKGLFTSWIQEVEPLNYRINRKYMLSLSDVYINFNYTKTLELIYNIPCSNIFYIHGQVSIPSSIQFGNPDNLKKQHQNDEFYKVVYEPAVETMYGYARNVYKDIEKNTGILSSFVNSYENIDEVIVMGHTLLGIDNFYYEEVFVQRFKNCLWTFYVHSNEDLERVNIFRNMYQLDNSKIVGW